MMIRSRPVCRGADRAGTAHVGLQLERIIRGFFKVTCWPCCSTHCRRTRWRRWSPPTPCRSDSGPHSGWPSSIRFFLYGNFSGYIDIVIALARLMRVRLPENFDRPSRLRHLLTSGTLAYNSIDLAENICI